MTTQDLKDTFTAFREQCIWTRICYNIYKNLYESGDETLNLLEQKAHTFFAAVNTILIEYCLTQMCKHLDPKETLGKPNLTIDFINSELDKANLNTQEIQTLSSQLANYRSLVKDARNKILAHSDLQTALQNKMLGAHPEADVMMFFENLQQYCDAVGNAVGVGPLDFRTTPSTGDVLDLLKCLKGA